MEISPRHVFDLALKHIINKPKRFSIMTGFIKTEFIMNSERTMITYSPERHVFFDKTYSITLFQLEPGRAISLIKKWTCMRQRGYEYGNGFCMCMIQWYCIHFLDLCARSFVAFLKARLSFVTAYLGGSIYTVSEIIIFAMISIILWIDMY